LVFHILYFLHFMAWIFHPCVIVQQFLSRIFSILHVTIFNFDARNHISSTAEARVATLSIQLASSLYSVGLGMTNYPLMGAVRVT